MFVPDFSRVQGRAAKTKAGCISLMAREDRTCWRNSDGNTRKVRAIRPW